MAQKIQKMFCPSCGAPISFEDGREDTFCSHCGSQLVREDDKIEVKMKHQEVMGQQAIDSKHADYNLQQDRHEVIFGIVAVAVILILCLVGFF